MTKPSSPIEVSKIRPGDKVTVELVVQNIGAAGVVVCAEWLTGYHGIHPDYVISHTPAPREIKVGSKVRHKSGGSRHWEVVAIHKTKAWLFCSIYSEHLQAALDNLVEVTP